MEVSKVLQKKANPNAYLALKAFWRLMAWWFPSCHLGDFSSFHLCLNLVLLSFFSFFFNLVFDFFPGTSRKRAEGGIQKICWHQLRLLPHGNAPREHLPFLMDLQRWVPPPVPPLPLVTHWSMLCFSWVGITLMIRVTRQFQDIWIKTISFLEAAGFFWKLKQSLWMI